MLHFSAMDSPADIGATLKEHRIDAGSSPVSSLAIHFDLESVEMMQSAEDTNFWPWVRRRLVTSLVKRFAKPPCDILDIGCGNGSLMRQLTETFPGSQVDGIDGHLRTLTYCRQRNPDAALMLQDISEATWGSQSRRYDVITIMDVLEHLDHPEAALRQATDLLKPGGIVIVSMPAHRWLWSPRDLFVGHRKRYDRQMTRTLLKEGGLRPLHINHLFSYLCAPAWLHRRIVARLFGKTGMAIEDTELKSFPVMNDLLKLIGTVEILLAQVMPLPFGTSVYAVAVRE